MGRYVNILKLCVGIDTVGELLRFQEKRAARDPAYLPRHVTRMWPKRASEVLDGGSLYWVIKGVVQARQRILRLEEAIGTDGIRRCAIIMERAVIRTEPATRRPFQGWRYLAPGDSPRDLAVARHREEALPPEMASALADIGVR